MKLLGFGDGVFSASEHQDAMWVVASGIFMAGVC